MVRLYCCLFVKKTQYAKTCINHKSNKDDEVGVFFNKGLCSKGGRDIAWFIQSQAESINRTKTLQYYTIIQASTQLDYKSNMNTEVLAIGVNI